MMRSHLPAKLLAPIVLCVGVLKPCLSLLSAEPTVVEKGLRLEVERQHDGPVDRLTVFICNNTDRDLTFETGAHGGPVDETRR